MIAWLLLMLSTSQAAPPQDMFSLRCDIQAWYDEVAQTILLSRTPSDADMLHSVFETDDVSFVDVDGQRQDWTAMRARALQSLQEPPADQMRQVMRDVKMGPDGAVAVAVSVTVRKVIDNEGRYGHAGASHAIATAINYRDTFVQSGTSWKLKVREQLGAPETLVDKLPRQLNNPRCGS
jgi:hypothetical protein